MGLKPKTTHNELEELREENKQLRKTVADLSERMLAQIAEIEPAGQSGSDETQ
jgi:cell division protein FtsB